MSWNRGYLGCGNGKGYLPKRWHTAKQISTNRLTYLLSTGRKSRIPEVLEKERWIKRSTIGEPRLSEIVDLYESLGYEVRVEPVKLEDLDEDCRRCYKKDSNKIKTIYVRKKVAE